MILLLTAGIMGITLFVLAKVAKRLGLRIKGKALALAGVLACAIACALPFVAPFLTEGYYIKLGALAVAAALLVTGYNAYLWKKDGNAAAEGADADEPASAKESAQTAEETLAARTRAAIGPQHFKWEPPDEPEEEAAEPEPESEPKLERIEKPRDVPQAEASPLGGGGPEGDGEGGAVTKVHEDQNQESPAPLPSPPRMRSAPPPEEEAPAPPTKNQEAPKEAPAEVKETKPEKPPEKKEEPVKKANPEPAPIEETAEASEPVLHAEPPSQRGDGPEGRGDKQALGALAPSDRLCDLSQSPAEPVKKQEVLSAGATKKEKPAEPPKQLPAPKPEPKPVEKPEPKSEPKEPQEPAPDFSTFTTLDDYLDYADAAQKKGDLEHAATAYANAVDIYANDPYIIYLYMDLGNLLKQQARYADCINVYHAALSIPILAENPAIAREFEKNIRYLEVVQAVLKRHHAEDTPFGDIPDAIHAEIEAANQALAKKSASKDETS
ncbi:MAG: hypothetical protein MR630_08890 [Selenomonas sp.]|uniref:hypothetical protein n=1 Tax=Selenomonas sp. TaxID=2053611 RepID=UPI0025F49135|nr:hypothetical protein [Selenomonas sp.]MCI6232708.1 hypothetical protein [Selenomonas sp.]